MNTVRSSDGTTIAFDQWGEGPPVIYAGGALNGRQALRWPHSWRGRQG